MPDETTISTDGNKRLSRGLARIHEQLQSLVHACETDEQASGIIAAMHEISSVRRLVDMPGPNDNRRDPRLPCSIGSYCMVDGAEIDCAIDDLSIRGAHIILDADLPIGTEMELAVPKAGVISASVVGLSKGGAHLAFGPIDRQQVNSILDSLEGAYWT